MYIDSSTCFLYEPSVMPESQLPPVYVKKDNKRQRLDPAVLGATAGELILLQLAVCTYLNPTVALQQLTWPRRLAMTSYGTCVQ